MKLLKIFLIIGVGFSLTFSTCKHGDLNSVSLPLYTFYIQNNSKDTFEYSYSTLYPDTSILNNLDSTFIIYPSQQGQIVFPVYLLPNFKTSGVVEIFLFNVDTLRKYNWQAITSNYLITRRYDLTYDSIEANNNVIRYP
jgi:hypothetical protein